MQKNRLPTPEYLFFFYSFLTSHSYSLPLLLIRMFIPINVFDINPLFLHGTPGNKDVD